MESTQIAELRAKHQKCDKILELIEECDEKINEHNNDAGFWAVSKINEDWYLHLAERKQAIRQYLITKYINQVATFLIETL